MPFQWPIASSKPTDDVILNPANAAYDKPSLPDHVTLYGVRFMRWLAFASLKDLRKRRSEIWKHGEQLVHPETGGCHYYCYLCEDQKKKQELMVINGNQGPLTHMLKSHGIDKDGCLVKKESAKGVVQSMVSIVTHNSVERFKYLLVRWIVYCHIAFHMLENEYFRALLSFINKGLAGYLPRAGKTIRGWVMAEYEKRKEALKAELVEALSSVHVSFDGWTSPNSYSIFSVSAHFIDKAGKRRTERLAFRRMRGEHTGVNIGAMLVEVLKEYSLEKRTGYFIADNGTNNDSAIEVVLKALYPRMSAKWRKARRLRCLGHITNLIAKAMLLGKGSGKAMNELERQVEKGALEAMERFWRDRGAVGKLHNIIRWIRASTQRLEAFMEVRCSGEAVMFNDLRLIQDNSTRWNSFYYMLGRAWSVKERLIEFCRLNRADPTVRENTLTPNDWQQIDRLHNALHVFELTAMSTQGNRKYLFEWYPTLQFTLDYTSKFSAEFKEEALIDERFSYLSSCCDHAWLKAEKYWKLADEMPIVYAAVVLNPTLKMGWFEDQWLDGTDEQQGYILQVRNLVKDLWVNDYRPSTSTASQITSTAPQTTALESSDLHDHLRAFKRRKIASTFSRIDALDTYLSTNCMEDTLEAPLDVLQWWFDRRLSEPELARFAFDSLAIPIMSDEDERAFSAGRDLIGYRRSCLQADTIEVCNCLRSWFGPPSKEAAFDSEEELVQYEYKKKGDISSLRAVEEHSEALEADITAL